MGGNATAKYTCEWLYEKSIAVMDTLLEAHTAQSIFKAYFGAHKEVWRKPFCLIEFIAKHNYVRAENTAVATLYFGYNK